MHYGLPPVSVLGMNWEQVGDCDWYIIICITHTVSAFLVNHKERRHSQPYPWMNKMVFVH